MNYEELYQDLQPDQKTLKDSLASLQKLFKVVSREVESGDLKSLAKDLSSMAEAAKTLTASLDKLQETVGSFDSKAYFEGGDFAIPVQDYCKKGSAVMQVARTDIINIESKNACYSA